MKCQTLFSGQNKKNITDLSSTDFADIVVKVIANCDNAVFICSPKCLNHMFQEKTNDISENDAAFFPI